MGKSHRANSLGHGYSAPTATSNDDYDDDEDADQEDGEQSDEPAVVREPEGD